MHILLYMTCFNYTCNKSNMVFWLVIFLTELWLVASFSTDWTKTWFIPDFDQEPNNFQNNFYNMSWFKVLIYKEGPKLAYATNQTKITTYHNYIFWGRQHSFTTAGTSYGYRVSQFVTNDNDRPNGLWFQTTFF